MQSEFDVRTVNTTFLSSLEEPGFSTGLFLNRYRGVLDSPDGKMNHWKGQLPFGSILQQWTLPGLIQEKQYGGH